MSSISLALAGKLVASLTCRNSAATSCSSASGQSSPWSHQEPSGALSWTRCSRKTRKGATVKVSLHFSSPSLACLWSCCFSDSGLLCFWELHFAVGRYHGGLLMQHRKIEQLVYEYILVFLPYFLRTFLPAALCAHTEHTCKDMEKDVRVFSRWDICCSKNNSWLKKCRGALWDCRVTGWGNRLSVDRCGAIDIGKNNLCVVPLRSKYWDFFHENINSMLVSKQKSQSNVRNH